MKWLALFVFVGCSQPAPTVVAPSSSPTEWVKVGAATGSTQVEAPARVLPSPASLAQVTPPFRAQVVKVRVRPGDTVVAGAALIDVVMPEVLDAAAKFEGANAKLKAWTERLTQLTALRAEGLAKAVDVSEASAKVAETKAELSAARATLLAASVREADVTGLLSGAGVQSLRAPLAGVVTQVSATLGEVRESSAGPVALVASLGVGRVEARFARPIPDGATVLVGSTGTVKLSRVSVAPGADPHDSTFVAWFEADGGLPAPGSLARVVVEGVAEQRWQVPARALVKEGSKTNVVTKSGPVSVEVLECGANDCTVRGALSADMSVQVGGR